MTEILKFPSKLTVGGLIYDISYPHEFEDGQDLLGLHSGTGGWIRIGNRKARSEGIRNKQAIMEVFVHEVLHAIDFIYCGDVLSEQEIETLTRALFQVLSDNDLCLETNDMPEVVRICGVNFIITDDYKYKDTGDSTSHVDFDTYSIYIGKDLNGMPFSDQFKKITFMYTLVHSMLYMYMSSKAIEVLRDKLQIRSLSNGLYQVLRDNKFEELFEKWTNRK